MKKIFMASALFLFSFQILLAEETLVLSHFLGPKSPQHSQFLAPWAKDIEEQSQGEIKVELFPSMTLGGRPPELYRQVRDGIADVIWTVIGYTPGVFPRSEVFELPTVHKNSARATNLAIQDAFHLIEEDYKDLKPLLVHVHAGNALHLTGDCVKSVSNFKGLKLRTPSRTGGWMISGWRAEPVGMPVPSLPQALSKKVVDGALVPFEIMPPLKLHELTNCSITGDNDGRFGTAVFLFAMNKDRYDSLSPKLKAVIDANSGQAIAEKIGAFWDSIELPGQELQRKTGSEVKALSRNATRGLHRLNEGVEKRWISEVNKVGIDGESLVEEARKAVNRHSQ